jgi:hypothetical protein
MQRTILQKHELDWLPPSYRALRWTVAGGVWTAVFGSVLAVSIFSHVHIFFFGKGLFMLGAGGYLAGDRAARGILRGRLRKLAHGAVDLSRLPAEPDGELVHVVGRARSRSGRPEIYRRLGFSFDGMTHAVHERADDFWLVGENSEPVLVDVADARLLTEGRPQLYGPDDALVREIEGLPLPADVSRALARREDRRRRGKSVGKLRVMQHVIKDGDPIEVLGYKSRTVDPTVTTRLERDTPFRATLRGGKNLPLLIVPTRIDAA